MQDLVFRLPYLSAFCALAASASGCIPDFETDLSVVKAPQLLAIAASPAEPQPGKSTTLTALVATPPERPASVPTWGLCLARKPLTELGPVNPDCLEPNPDAATVLDLGAADSVQATLDKDVCKVFGPLRAAQMGSTPAGRPVDPDVTGGFYQPVVTHLGGVVSLGAIRIACDQANLDREDAVLFKQQYRPNENPRISELSMWSESAEDAVDLPPDAKPLAIRAGSSLTLRASWEQCPTASECGDGYCTANEDLTSCAEDCPASGGHGCTGAEQYVWYNREAHGVEPRREDVSVAWYTSSGHFDNEQTGRPESEASSARSSENVWRVGELRGPATVWIVIRDSRGGQSWEVRQFEVMP